MGLGEHGDPHHFLERLLHQCPMSGSVEMGPLVESPSQVSLRLRLLNAASVSRR